ncbi:MAG: hypothetical protein ACR2P0_02405 [Acidimicrobiales bacterium]
MPPWTILALILGIGFVVLLFAPRLHRRSMARSRESMESARLARVAAMRSKPSVIEIDVDSAVNAARIRDALLLRGVRVEIATDEDRHVLVTHESDETAVRSVIEEQRRR